jgi:hypothetical protein
MDEQREAQAELDELEREAEDEQREAFAEGRTAYDPDEGLSHAELVALETERWSH